MSEYQGPDPHDIVPDDFPYASLTAARQDIEADYLHAKRCPVDGCGSTNITPLSSKATSGTDESYKCKKCRQRFDDPAPPAAEMPEHKGCGSQRWVVQLSRTRYRCYRCETTWTTLEHFDERRQEVAR